MGKLNKTLQEMIDNSNTALYREEIYINGRHEYDYHKLEATSDVTVHTLYFSEDDEWPDESKKVVAMQLVDDGNGIQIIGICKKKDISYGEAERLHILLRLSSTNSVFEIAEPSPKKEF